MPINELDFFKKGSCASATNVVCCPALLCSPLFIFTDNGMLTQIGQNSKIGINDYYCPTQCMGKLALCRYLSRNV